jgi:AraC family transcriptional regulator of adaptative response/methylated-DNA-[protein]-cysteine methyltransferase
MCRRDRSLEKGKMPALTAAIDTSTAADRRLADLNPAEAWAAVLRRDRARDGQFVYAVKTTGIYCRPSCPSKRPHFINVAFFERIEDAERNGYRACRRCNPKDSSTRAQALVLNARAYLEAHVEDPVTLAHLAGAVGVSPFHLQRTFTRELGLSPKRYLTALRAGRFKDALRRGSTVLDATFEAGFGASSRAYEVAPAYFGMTPSLYRRGAPGVTIRFTMRATRLGVLLVAATDRGVCAVFLGDDVMRVEQSLAQEYPKAVRTRVPADGGSELEADLRAWADAVVQCLEGHEPTRVPTDLAATPFQRRVWEALRQIPYGETRSYGAIARAIGAPRASRAVAGACARNRLAMLIPCHRVIREDGDPGGYRWGGERKRRLLAAEGAARR